MLLLMHGKTRFVPAAAKGYFNDIFVHCVPLEAFDGTGITFGRARDGKWLQVWNKADETIYRCGGLS